MHSNARAPGSDRDDRSLGELFSELSRETSTLMRQEVELAKTEVKEKASRVGKDGGLLAGGAVIAYAGFLTLIASLVIGLAELGLPWWLSAFLVGAIVVIIGGVIAQRGWNDLKRADLTPRETVDSLKRDTEMVKEQI